MIFGFFRFLLLALLLFAGWTMLKVLFRIFGFFLQVRRAVRNAGGAAPARDKGSRNVEEMAQDPNCGSYVSTSHSVSGNFRGGTVYFCSQKCLDEYRLKIG
ncbi:MAG: hypothetical protein HY098_08590 [Nitrospinae bacterium]|nr:hypothetical protein [Nitrospinota bacterium]